MYFAKKFKEQYVENDLKEYFSKEVNFLALNHRAIINIIGYSPVDHKNKPYPVIISEYAANNTLKNILSNEIRNNQKSLLNDTKRLIIIYGIASGMAYLHSHDIIHTKLKPSNIFLDDFLFPKIYGYNYCTNLSANPIPDINQLISFTNNFNNGFYTSPEHSNYYNDSSAGDVYSFAIITYVLISNQNPFPEKSKEIKQQVLSGKLRPTFNESVPCCYRKLIEKCLAHEPKERPTFDEIIYHLKTNSEFINENIDKEEYLNYINFIEKALSTKNDLQVDDFIKTTNKTFRKVHIDFKNIQDPFKQNFLINMGSLDLQKYERQQKIGEGGFGVVYQLREKDEGTLYAAKISKLEIDQSRNDTIIDLSREINIISQLNHPTILSYIGFSPINFKNKQKPVIVTEYASNGSLDKILEKERKGFGIHEWDDTKKLINIYGIASGLSYLHRQNIIHRDLKPANILLDDYLYPKIADFGLSKKLTEQDKYDKWRKTPKTSGFKGTYSYCAPEVIDSNIYTKSGDVYSFGMIMYEIMTNEIPFQNINIFQLMLKLSKGYRPNIKYPIPYCYRKLIENCWCQNPDFRPKIDDVVKKLETDKQFLTQNVDEEEFHNYIYSIKGNINECVQENTENRSICNFANKVSFNNKNSNKVEENDIIETEENIFIDLAKYKRKDIISKGEFSKLYKLQEIDTGLLFSGQISMLKIKKIPKDDLNNFSHELKIIIELNHPSLLKFIGYSPLDFKKSRKPVIVTEYACNGSLEDILHHERIGKSIDGWNETKKLINIFGIASAMSYFHLKNIIHRSLKTSTIYLDEILTPKIGDFGLSTRFPSSEDITVQTISWVKAIPIYSAPEVLQSNEYSKSSDVYAFSFIVFEILTNEIPFQNITNNNQIFNEVVINHKRPEIKKSIPNSYRYLIEKCWSQNANDRPTFDQIVTNLKTDPQFITSNINKDDYFQYIKIVEKQIKSIKIEEKDDSLNNNFCNSYEINEKKF